MSHAAVIIFSLFLPVFLSPAAPAVDRGLEKSITLPDTHAGRCAKAFLDAFNSGDAGRVRAFEEAHRAQSSLRQRSIEERLKQFEQMRSDWGSLEARHVVDSKEREITVLVYVTLPDQHFEFHFVFEDSTPFGLRHIEIQGPIEVEASTEPIKPLTAESRSSALEAVAQGLEANYVFPEVGSRMAALLREKAASKSYDAVVTPSEFARRLTEDLRSICHDKHLAVRVGRGPDLHAGGPMRRSGTRDDARRDNFGFRMVEHLPGNIGYIRFDEFHPGDDAKRIAAGAMAFVAGCDALIFDLRNNGGGSPEMIRFLSSYLFDKPTHLNSFYDRTNNKTEEFWTTEDVPGRRLGEELLVFVLISGQTFSGAEEFAYNLRNLKRATLVGETTGGGAHPVRSVEVNEQFHLMVPFARAVNPITKTNWEGVGVQPHVEIEASQALEKARSLASAEIQKKRNASSTP